MRKLAIILVLMTAFMANGCGKEETKVSADANISNGKSEEVTDSLIIETGNTVTSYLTGKQVDEAIGRQRPISVMFNNVEEGCPQTGISRADVVYEAPLAANTTRLIGIIENWHDMKKIGSIRSTRDYYVSFALEFDAIHVHFGQATAYVGDMLNSDLVDNLSGAVAGIEHPATNTFYRSDDRKAPHNVYASAEGIMEDIQKFEYNLTYDESYYGKFKFAKDGEDLDYSKYPDATLIYPGGKETGKPNGFSNVGAYFQYNKDDGKYYRYQYGAEHIDDMTGEQLAYDNVVFQYCYGEVRDKEGYLAFECFGSDKSNKSIVFTEGKMIEGTWWRDGSNSAPAKYLDENGDRVVMNQGKTWICIIWSQYADDVVIEGSSKTAENSETEMIYIKVLDKLFYNTGKDVTEEVIESIEAADIDTPYIGTVLSVVDSGIKPTKDMQANFGSVGAEVVFYDDGIAVNIDGKWIEFEASN